MAVLLLSVIFTVSSRREIASVSVVVLGWSCRCVFVPAFFVVVYFALQITALYHPHTINTIYCVKKTTVCVSVLHIFSLNDSIWRVI